MKLRGPDDRGDGGGGWVGAEGLRKRGLKNGEAGMIGYGVGAYTHHWSQDNVASGAVNAGTVRELEGTSRIGVGDLPTADDDALAYDRSEDLGNAGNAKVNAGAEVAKDRVAGADSGRLRSGWREEEEEEGKRQPELGHYPGPMQMML